MLKYLLQMKGVRRNWSLIVITQFDSKKFYTKNIAGGDRIILRGEDATKSAWQWPHQKKSRCFHKHRD